MTMDAADLDALAARITARMPGACATEPCRAEPPPKNGHAAKWLGGVAAVLAAAAVVAAVNTWRGLAVVESEVSTTKQGIADIAEKLDTIGTKVDQLIGAEAARNGKPAGGRR